MQRIEAVFEEAADLTPSQRVLFLDRTCADDRELREEIERMLAVDAGAPERIRDAVGAEASRVTSAEGKRYGPWRVTGIVGTGGMGAVYRVVRDDDQYRKQAALKILRGGFDSDFARARFRYERQILAQLEHANIARLVDGGQIEGGAPYLVMELVEGVPITDYCREKNLPVAERLRLFRQVCEAVRYAHQNMVVHRDLKPGNILVNAEGAPKLLDFGIAKLTVADYRPETLALTSTGMRLMTPEYASPEQVRGEPVSAATDIYSLGTVLYEVLTGRKAHRISRADPLEIARVVCETETVRPSQAAPEPVRRQLAGDLDNIVLKAMHKDAARRYPSVEQFSEDIRRHLEGLPVLARKDTLAYRAGKFIRRNRAALVAAVVAVCLAAAGVVSIAQQRRRAENRFQQVRKLVNRFLTQFDQEIRQVPGTIKARELLVATAVEYLDSLAKEARGDPTLQLELAQAYEQIGDIQGMFGLPNLGRPADAMASYRKSLAIKRGLVAQYPRTLDHWRYLTLCLERMSFLQTAANDLAGARASLQEALRVEEQSLKGRQPDGPDARLMANGNLYLAWTEEREGKAPTSVEAATRGVEWMQISAKLREGVRARSDLARAYGALGKAKRIRGDLEGARASYLEEWQRRKAIAAEVPNHTENLREWAEDSAEIGSLLGGDDGGPNFGDPAGARSYLDQALRLFEKLGAADPDSISARKDMAFGYAHLANALRETESGRAMELFRKALAVIENLPDTEAASRRTLTASLTMDMSYPQRKAGDRQGARLSAQRALQLAREARAAEPGIESGQRMVRAGLAVGDAALDGGDLVAAREAFSEAVRTAEEWRELARTNLELATALSGAWEGLERWCEKAANGEEAVRLRGTRVRLWEEWGKLMPSVFTRLQVSRAGSK